MSQLPGVCYVVGALPLEGHLRPRPAPGDLLVAADKGYETLSKLGLCPDLVVGDFDSLPAPPTEGEVIRLPRIKDETDMAFALELGWQRGYRRFLILGGMGGRLDHTLANLQLLAGISRRGGRAIAAGSGSCALAVTGGTVVFPPSMGGRCSVFCVGEGARADLEGLQYPLVDEPLTPQVPLGVSNEFLGVEARVTARTGTLLVVWEHQTDCRGLCALLESIEQGAVS